MDSVYRLQSLAKEVIETGKVSNDFLKAKKTVEEKAVFENNKTLSIIVDKVENAIKGGNIDDMFSPYSGRQASTTDFNLLLKKAKVVKKA